MFSLHILQNFDHIIDRRYDVKKLVNNILFVLCGLVLGVMAVVMLSSVLDEVLTHRAKDAAVNFKWCVCD